MRANTVSATEAAYLLMKGLGPIRAWKDFLTDNIRGRQSVSGETLLPCCEQHDGRLFRPRYALSDIRVFVAAVRLKIAEKYEINTVTLDLDPAREWFLRKFDKDGAVVLSS